MKGGSCGAAWAPVITARIMRAIRRGLAAIVPGVFVLVGILGFVPAAHPGPLVLESKIPLGDVRGRIDHLAVDLNRQILYVAELGNDSVGVVDLRERRTVRTLTGLKEPQGIGYVPSTDTLYIANAGDGSVRLFKSADLAPVGQIELGDDADNVRVDDTAHRVYVGYGKGGLAVIDTESGRKIADIALKAHPESFQLEHSGQYLYVNVPDRREIASVDRVANKQVASWPTDDMHANFPLALDEPQKRILAVFRHPARLGVFRTQDGQLLTSADTCADADDVFVDEKRNRVYVSCGEGVLDVLTPQAKSYASMGRTATAPGARTALFVSDIDRLVLAVRSTGTTPASIWVFRPE
jgi:DNA-binding beta-propeller fold protein YncE